MKPSDWERDWNRIRRESAIREFRRGMTVEQAKRRYDAPASTIEAWSKEARRRGQQLP